MQLATGTIKLIPFCASHRVCQDKHCCVRPPVGVIARVNVHRFLPPNPTLLLVLLPLLYLQQPPELHAKRVHVLEMKRPEVREKMSIDKLVGAAVKLLLPFVVGPPELRGLLRLEAFRKTNEVQRAAMVDLDGARGEPAGKRVVSGGWRCCRRRHRRRPIGRRSRRRRQRQFEPTAVSWAGDWTLRHKSIHVIDRRFMLTGQNLRDSTIRSTRAASTSEIGNTGQMFETVKIFREGSKQMSKYVCM